MADKPLFLVVEDDRSIRNILKAVLSTQGYGFVEAETGREALSLAASHVPDLVILDLGLPDICLLYTSDAADDLLCVDLGGRRILKKTHHK